MWIDVLERTRALRPLSCPVGEDLSQLDLAHLRRIAHHSIRLEHNWSREYSRIMGSMRVLHFEDEQDSITVIPGTEIVLSLSLSLEKLTCYDLQAATPVARLRIGIRILGAHYDGYGKHLMAMYCRDLDDL
jgi:hypothetical protein